MEKFFEKLRKLYIKMDKAYEEAASHYGFKCRGCEDNCCRSFFYHHTFIEKDFLLSRAGLLSRDWKKSLKERAELYLNTLNTKPICPLNNDDICVLYDVRPMICRLHGIPHHLNIPGRKTAVNPGCGAGTSLFEAVQYFSFDRVPFYTEMAAIEKEYRKATRKTGKIKETIAHMLSEL